MHIVYKVTSHPATTLSTMNTTNYVVSPDVNYYKSYKTVFWVTKGQLRRAEGDREFG